MPKVALNGCYGGFSLSKPVIEYMAERGHERAANDLKEWDDHYSGGWWLRDEDRTDPLLIEAIEHVGVDKASGSLASLRIADIPDDVEWTIQEYDGIEWAAEVHRTW